ncbi:MAG: TolC family protein [Deferribacterales bacterium]
MRKVAILCITALLAVSANAMGLQDMIGEVSRNNPSVKEKLKYYNSVYQEYEKAKGGYLPRLDLYGGVGHEWVSNSNTDYEERDSDVYQARIVLQQDIFTGFGVQNEVKKEYAKLNSAKYTYFNEVNEVAFETATQYISAVKSLQMFDFSNELLKKQQVYIDMIQDRVDQGMDLASDLERANAKVAGMLADNLMKENVHRAALIKLSKLLGRYIEGNELIRPDFDIANIPASLQDGMVTLKNENPMLVSAKYDIDYQKFNHKESKKEYFPRIYAEFSHDINDNMSGVDGFERETRAMLMMDFNLFNGTKDVDEAKKNVSLYHKSVDAKNRVSRDLASDYQLTWSAHRLLMKQISYLQKNKNALEKVLKSYKSEFKIGKRKLIDIMNLENEIFAVDGKITEARYDALLFKYKLLYTLGTLPQALQVVTPVAYGSDDLPEMEDKLPVSFDMDEDKVEDAGDFCQNSKGGEIGSGCDEKTTETFLNSPFVEPKPALDSRVISSVSELATNKLKTNSRVTTGIEFFEKDSTELTMDAVEIMREMVKQLQEISSGNSIEIYVYSADNGDAAADYQLSSKRAYNLFRIMLINNVSRSALITYGKDYPKAEKYPQNFVEIIVRDSSETYENVYEIYSGSDLSFVNEDGADKTANPGSLSATGRESLRQYAMMAKTVGSDVAVDVINFSYDKADPLNNKKVSEERSKIVSEEIAKMDIENIRITNFGIDYELLDDISYGKDAPKNKTYLIIHK